MMMDDFENLQLGNHPQGRMLAKGIKEAPEKGVMAA
jgi:hypothetical protein